MRSVRFTRRLRRRSSPSMRCGAHVAWGSAPSSPSSALASAPSCSREHDAIQASSYAWNENQPDVEDDGSVGGPDTLLPMSQMPMSATGSHSQCDVVPSTQSSKAVMRTAGCFVTNDLVGAIWTKRVHLLTHLPNLWQSWNVTNVPDVHEIQIPQSTASPNLPRCGTA